MFKPSFSAGSLFHTHLASFANTNVRTCSHVWPQCGFRLKCRSYDPRLSSVSRYYFGMPFDYFESRNLRARLPTGCPSRVLRVTKWTKHRRWLILSNLHVVWWAGGRVQKFDPLYWDWIFLLCVEGLEIYKRRDALILSALFRAVYTSA